MDLSTMRGIAVYTAVPLALFYLLSVYTEYSISFLITLANLNALFILCAAFYIPGATSTPIGMAVIEQLMFGAGAILSLIGAATARAAPFSVHGKYAAIEIRENGQKYTLLVPYNGSTRKVRTNKTWVIRGESKKLINHHPGIPILVSPEDLQCDRIEITDLRNKVIHTLEGRHSRSE